LNVDNDAPRRTELKVGGALTYLSHFVGKEAAEQFDVDC
jgi:hypothetical protein